jgi:GNAT superfamily N-acetyltransferase
VISNVPKNEIVEAVKLHWRLQLGSYFEKVQDIGGAVYNLGKEVEDHFWNYAGMIDTDEKNAKAVIGRVEAFARDHGRVPAFFIDPSTAPASFSEILRENKYAPGDDEIWMTAASMPTKQRTSALTIREVKSPGDMKLFVDIFHDSYGMLDGNETTTPYSDALNRAFLAPPANVAILHFIGYAGPDPVTVASAYISREGAGLYNVGTHPEHLRKGYGGEISIHAIEHAFSRGARRIILQTELGGNAESLYKRIGFSRMFSGVFWAQA